MNRRGFLKALAAAPVAPYVITTAGVLMPVKVMAKPTQADIGFVQSGTGATSRTLQEKLREWHNVRDYGAVGDGVTDDSQAFANAILAASYTNGKVYVPAGVYRRAELHMPARDGGWEVRFDPVRLTRIGR